MSSRIPLIINIRSDTSIEVLMETRLIIVQKKSSKNVNKGRLRARENQAQQVGLTPGMAPEVMRAHQPGLGEIFGVVVKILGGNHLEVIADDGKRRVIRIPGKMNRRKWVRTGDLVLIEPWYGLNEDDKGDLKYGYQKNEYRGLFKNERHRLALQKLGIEPRPVQEEVRR